jgi:subtilisin family serine protease
MHKIKTNLYDVTQKASFIPNVDTPSFDVTLPKKRVCVTCKDSVTTDSVYDLLTLPDKGEGALSGSIPCVHEHDDIPNIMEFELSAEQINALKKINGVVRVTNSNLPRKHRYTKVNSEITPAIADSRYNSVTSVAPHSLYYGQECELSYIDDNTTLGTLVSLSSIDCSNVDIIIWDSGVDASHYEFSNPIAGHNGRVKQFDWTQLKTDTNTPIVSAIPLMYYQDKEGHGTACASLAAGNKCGFAKNASIFLIKDQNLVGPNDKGFTGTQCLQLVLAFLKAKANNQYGLNKLRPTIISCSWGPVGPNFSTIMQSLDLETYKFASTFGYGFTSGLQPASLPAGDDVLDAYFREYLNLGAHVVVAANDSNAFESNELPSLVQGTEISGDTIVGGGNLFSDINRGSAAKIKIVEYYVAIRDTTNNTTTYTLDFSVASANIINFLKANNNTFKVKSGTNILQYTALGIYEHNYTYGSPNIGITDVTVGGNINYVKSNYPLIKVGDVTPIGNIAPNNTASGLYWSANQAYTAYWLLSNTKFTDFGLVGPLTAGNLPDSFPSPLSAIRTDSVCYTSPRGPFFTKTCYSGFGPDLDIYAPGNATWAAKSNQIASSSNWRAKDPINGASLPIVTVEASTSYQFFNGTSAATPIVAGILGTILADNPGFTNKQARDYLLKTGVHGGIMSTVPNYRLVTDYKGSSQHVPASIWQDASIDAFPNNTIDDPNLISFLYYLGKPYNMTNNLTNLLFFTRFFNSSNLIAQAFPLRKVILNNDLDNLTINSLPFTKTDLTLQYSTSATI